MSSNTTIANGVLVLAFITGILVHYKLWEFALPCGILCIAVPVQHLADILVLMLRELEAKK